MGYGPGPGSEIAQAAIEKTVAPFLEGRTLADPDALRVQFFEQPMCDVELRKVYCAVEVALFDLASQAQGVPLSELVGGRVRDRIRLYGSAGMYMDPERYAEEAAAIAGLGFSAYKMRPGRGPEQDLEISPADARSGRSGFRPDGGRAHLVAHGRPQLQRGNRGPDGQGDGGLRMRLAGRAASAGRSRSVSRFEREGSSAAGQRRA